MLINKNKTKQNKNLLSNGLCRSIEPLSKNKKKRKTKTEELGKYQFAEKAVKHEIDGDNNCIW